MANLEDIKKLREETSVSIIECKKALEEAGGDMDKARELLRERGAALAEKKAEREAGEGIIDSYVHNTLKVGVLLELSCETDFVARSEEFQTLAHEIALQISSMNPENVEELLAQDFIKDPKRTIQSLITDAVGKLGEKIEVRRFTRYSVGE